MRFQYTQTQKHWAKNSSKCIQYILDNKTVANAPAPDIMAQYSTNVFTKDFHKTPSRQKAENEDLPLIRNPVIMKEISNTAKFSAPGSDGVSARLYTMANLLNLILYMGNNPNNLLESYTTLIHKIDNATEPGDYRPITVSSVITRLLNKILARRLLSSIKIDTRQKAFHSVDGCAHNTWIPRT